MSVYRIAYRPVREAITARMARVKPEGDYFLVTEDRQSYTWEVALRDPTDSWIWDDHQNQWLYGVGSPVRLHVQCRADGGAETTERVLSGSGNLRVPAGCTVWTPTYRLLPMAEINETFLPRAWNWTEVSPVRELKLPEGMSAEEEGEWVQNLNDLVQTANRSPGQPGQSYSALSSFSVSRGGGPPKYRLEREALSCY